MMRCVSSYYDPEETLESQSANSHAVRRKIALKSLNDGTLREGVAIGKEASCSPNTEGSLIRGVAGLRCEVDGSHFFDMLTIARHAKCQRLMQ